MSEPERELLIVLTPGADPSEVVSSAGGRLTQRFADRLALAVVPADARQALSDRPEVLDVYDDAVPDAVAQELGETERLFVEAWRERGRAKHRVGEGRSWDSPGLEAP